MLTTATILYLTLTLVGQPTVATEYPTPEACEQAVKSLKPIYDGNIRAACIDRNTGKLTYSYIKP